MSNRINKFKNDIKNHINTQFCSICYSSFNIDNNNNISTTKCGHFFCTSCMWVVSGSLDP